MSKIKISTNAPKVERSLEVEYDFGDNLQEAIALFGEEVVFTNAKQNMVISLQSVVRSSLEKKEENRMEDSAIITKIEAWKPGIATVRTTDRKAAALKAFEKLSAEEKEALIAQLRGM